MAKVTVCDRCENHAENDPNPETGMITYTSGEYRLHVKLDHAENWHTPHDLCDRCIAEIIFGQKIVAAGEGEKSPEPTPEGEKLVVGKLRDAHVLPDELAFIKTRFERQYNNYRTYLHPNGLETQAGYQQMRADLQTLAQYSPIVDTALKTREKAITDWSNCTGWVDGTIAVVSWMAQTKTNPSCRSTIFFDYRSGNFTFGQGTPIGLPYIEVEPILTAPYPWSHGTWKTIAEWALPKIDAIWEAFANEVPLQQPDVAGAGAAK